MRISFDIDETLVLHRTDAPKEIERFPRFIYRWFGEPLRRDACRLIRELRSQGHSIWVYTSSVRSSFHIHLWLLLYGIRIDGVVNDERHRRELAGYKFSRLPSKFPPAFGIDLHIDDSDGVQLEAKEHNFRVFIVNPSDGGWAKKVLDEVKRKLG